MMGWCLEGRRLGISRMTGAPGAVLTPPWALAWGVGHRAPAQQGRSIDRPGKRSEMGRDLPKVTKQVNGRTRLE